MDNQCFVKYYKLYLKTSASGGNRRDDNQKGY